MLFLLNTTDQSRHESRVRANVNDRNTQFLIRMHERDVACSLFGTVFRIIYHHNVMNNTTRMKLCNVSAISVVMFQRKDYELGCLEHSSPRSIHTKKVSVIA